MKIVLAPKLLGGLVVNILKIIMYLLCQFSRCWFWGMSWFKVLLPYNHFGVGIRGRRGCGVGVSLSKVEASIVNHVHLTARVM